MRLMPFERINQNHQIGGQFSRTERMVIKMRPDLAEKTVFGP